jgi:hypothetical protein
VKHPRIPPAKDGAALTFAVRHQRRVRRVNAQMRQGKDPAVSRTLHDQAAKARRKTPSAPKPMPSNVQVEVAKPGMLSQLLRRGNR